MDLSEEQEQMLEEAFALATWIQHVPVDEIELKKRVTEALRDAKKTSATRVWINEMEFTAIDYATAQNVQHEWKS